MLVNHVLISIPASNQKGQQTPMCNPTDSIASKYFVLFWQHVRSSQQGLQNQSRWSWNGFHVTENVETGLMCTTLGLSGAPPTLSPRTWHCLRDLILTQSLFIVTINIYLSQINLVNWQFHLIIKGLNWQFHLIKVWWKSYKKNQNFENKIALKVCTF